VCGYGAVGSCFCFGIWSVGFAKSKVEISTSFGEEMEAGLTLCYRYQLWWYRLRCWDLCDVVQML
jgi:hypothetical protein